MTWAKMEAGAPDLAAAGRRLLKADGSAVAYLATVRKDGGPRVHPVMPVLADGSLFVFVVSLGWKYRDLLRDGRYALHSSASPDDGEEFYITGPATPVLDTETRERVREASGGRLGGHDFEVLFELGVKRALHTKWVGWGTPEIRPEYVKWSAAG